MSLISEVKKKVNAAKEAIKPVIKYEILLNTDNNGYYTFTVKNYYISIAVHISPFANCQLCSMSPVENLRGIDDTNMIKALLAKIYSSVQKRMFAIDIKKESEEDILKQLEPYIQAINKTDYLSANGSAMVMCVFRLNLESIK